MINVRNIAMKILEEVYDKGCFVNEALDRYFNFYEMTPEEKAFINRVVYGTLEYQIQSDYILEQFSSVKIVKMKKPVLYLMRMSIYQLMYMDQIPDYSVTNEAVKWIKKRGMGNLSGFVNGVLRQIIRNKDQITYPKPSDVENYLSVKYSFPKWLVAMLINQYDEKVTERILSESLQTPKVCIRKSENTSEEELLKELTDEGIEFTKGNILPYAYYLENAQSIRKMKAFQKGLFQVQDESSMLVTEVINPQKDQIIYDACAAPGGKTTHIAQRLNDTGKVISSDVSDKKLELIRENCQRLGLNNVEIRLNDGTVLDETLIQGVDVVVTDVPCSGLGIIKKKPDIKYNVTKEGISELIELQRKIISTCSNYVKPGGLLIYSTCTINEDENIKNIRWFLEHNDSYELEPFELNYPNLQGQGKDGYLLLLPDSSISDGFFIAKLRRMK